MSENIFGIRLRECRKARGFTLDGLAKMCVISKGALCDLEHGNQKPSFNTIIEVSNNLNVSSDYLLGLTRSLNGSMNDALCTRINSLPKDYKELVLDIVECMVRKLKNKIKVK